MSANVGADREVTYAERQTIRTLLANYQRELNTPPLKPGCALYLTPDVFESREANHKRLHLPA